MQTVKARLIGKELLGAPAGNMATDAFGVELARRFNVLKRIGGVGVRRIFPNIILRVVAFRACL